ncbi:MAG TPA: hypothetical protein PKD27_10480 [Tepidiformaceae bacterium]|nr:hypothetical protein [Tepidiformaceae bacterium]
MRILAIGYALPNVAVDNYNPLTAPSYNDYEVLFIDPIGIDRTVRELLNTEKEYTAMDGRPVLNAPTSAASVSIADQLKRRIDETRRLLEDGGLVVVAARPDALQSGVLGFEGCDRYHWLPAPGGLSWGQPYLKAAEGKTVRISAEDHPFSAVLREHRKEVTYRAVFDDRQTEVRKLGKILATGGAGIPIAMEFEVLGGRVVFVPVMSEAAGAGRTKVAQAVVDACRQLSGATFEEPAPYWTKAVAVPGLEQIEAELEEADAAATAATSHASAVRERHDELARYRRILWEDGQRYSHAATEALRMIGFTVASEPLEPLVIESEGARAFVEFEASRSQVTEWPYIRLQRRLEEHMLKTGESLKGVIIANGLREKDPEQRSEELSEPLQVACENYRYGLITSRTLFELVRRVLGGAEDATLLGVRRRWLKGAGLVSLEELTGDAAEEKKDTGPIF